MMPSTIALALGLGEGGEQNAPLGRAVIGGLLFGTPATLIIVPSILAVLGRRLRRSESRIEAGAQGADAGVAI